MTDPDELWVVTVTVAFADQDRWEDECGNPEWIDVDVHSTFEVYRGPRIECERYVENAKAVKVHDGKLVRNCSWTTGPAWHWDQFVEDMR
jgi:hypothetical protein